MSGRILFQPAHEEAIIFIDECKAAEFEEGEIEQKEAVTQPGASFEEGTLVGNFVDDVVDEVQHDARCVVVSDLKLGEESL